jgi:hypothetical protein
MKTRKSRQSTIVLKDFQHQEARERKFLHSRYKDQKAIINQLCEIPVNIRTYEFLAELFFNAAARELENDPPTEDWIKQLRDVRNDVFQLFEMARAAKAFKI